MELVQIYKAIRCIRTTFQCQFLTLFRNYCHCDDKDRMLNTVRRNQSISEQVSEQSASLGR